MTAHTDPLTIPADDKLDPLWLAVEAAPDDRLVRGVYADRLRELRCDRLADAVEATADRWPDEWVIGVYWFDSGQAMECRQRHYYLPPAVFEALTEGERVADIYRDYDTAREAMHDLWRAWAAVHAGEGVPG